MRIYTYHSSQTTPPAELDLASKRRAAFARQAVRLEFRTRDARALDQGYFVDRKPNVRPRHIGEVAAKVTRAAGQNSLRHWLNQASRADTDEEREAALAVASEIANLMGLEPTLIAQEVA